MRDKLPFHVNPFIDSDMEDATEDFMLVDKNDDEDDFMDI